MFRSLINQRRRVGSRLAAFSYGVLASLAASANPQGAQVVSGTASFSAPDPSTLQITNSPGAILNWQSFNIGPHETTQFIQQSAQSAVLNRVTGPGASTLLGNLLSNGRVFLINQAGILIGENAVVDTAGLVLSTLGISDADFLAGRLHFEGEGNQASIVNHGYLKTGPGGELILIAPKIVNEPAGDNPASGLIETEQGELLLAAGESITITSLDDAGISFEVQAPSHEVVNLGRLLAEGGTARVLAGTIRHSGEIDADTLSVDAQGRVVLQASARIETSADSVVTANGSAGLPGGAVRIEAPELALSGAASADGDAGGEVLALGEQIALSGASMTANATTGAGGKVRVGGGYQGGDALPAAKSVTVDGGSRLEANSQAAGDGGSVVVWSDERTEFRGFASASGGLSGGNGGLVEVSGKQSLVFSGSAHVGAPRGTPGTLLLDPKNIFIFPELVTDFVDPTAVAGDRLGASGVSVLANGNILVANQRADVGALVDAGEILVFNSAGAFLGSVQGNAANEALGSIFHTVLPTGLLFRSPNASNGAITQAGAFILVNPATGLEIARLSGTSMTEQLGNFGFSIRANGNLAIPSPFADPGGVADAGSVLVVSNALVQVGRFDGNTAGERFGQNTNFFTLGQNDFLVFAAGHSNNAGIVAQLASVDLGGGNIRRGGVTGAAAGDRVGDENSIFGGFALPSGNYIIRARNMANAGNAAAGAVFVVDQSTGNVVTQVNGSTANAGLSLSIDRNTLGFSDNFAILNPADRGGAGVVHFVNGADGGGLLGSFFTDVAGDGVGGWGLRSVTGGILIPIPDADVGGFTDAGSVVLVNTGGVVLGRVDGASNSEFLGQSVDLFSLFGNNFLIHSSLADPGGLVDAGSVILVDRTTGNEVGRTNGTSAGEGLGQYGFVQTLSSGHYVIFSDGADPGGIIDAGSVILVDGALGTRIGSTDGTSASEFLGSELFVYERLSGNYFIQSRFADPGGLVDAGSLLLADGATGLLIGQVDGTASGEQFSALLDDFALGFSDVIVRSPAHVAGNFANAGTVIRIADVDTDPGPGVDLIQFQVDGTSANEHLGSLGVNVRGNGNIVIRSPGADVGAAVDAGTVIVMDGTTHLELGRFNGDTAGEQFGNSVDFFTLNSDDFLVFAPNHGGTFGLVAQLASVDLGGGNIQRGGVVGSAANDFIGNDGFVWDVLPNGNYILRARNASNGGNVNAGAVFVVDPTDGSVVAQVRGNDAGAGLNLNIDTFTLGSVTGDFNKFAVLFPADSNAAGVIRLVDGSTGGLLGTFTGAAGGDSAGANGIQAFGGNILVRVPNADLPGPGFVDAGSIYLIDAAANVLGRVDGASNAEFLGSVVPSILGNGNVLIRSLDADPGGIANAGTVIVMNSDLSAEVGRFSGNAANERFGQFVDLFTLSATSDDILVFASGHNNGAGIVAQLAAVDLGGGNIRRGGVDGAAAGDLVGNDAFVFDTLPSGNYIIRARNVANGASANAGAVFVVDQTTGNVVTEVKGNTANAGLSLSIDTFTLGFSDNFMVLNGADNSGAGVIHFVNGADGGGILGSFTTGVAGDGVGGSGIFSVAGGDIVARVPNADVSGLVDAGSLIQLDPSNGQLVQRVNGISANERFGLSGPVAFLAGGRLLFASPDADVNGVVDAGRLAIFDPNAGGVTVTDFTFANQPFSDLSIGNLTLQNLLSGGATVILQANNDIKQLAGADVVASSGTLTLQAGRRIELSADLIVPTLNLIANESAANGAIAANRDFGPGDLIVTGARVSGDAVSMTAQNIVLQAGTVLDPATMTLDGAPVLVGAAASLAMSGSDSISVLGAHASGGFGVVLSGGDLSIDAPEVLFRAGTSPIAEEGVELTEFFEEVVLVDEELTLEDVLTFFAGTPPFVLAMGSDTFDITTDSLIVEGGSSSNAFAVLAAITEFNIDAAAVELLPGEGENADALLGAIGGAINFITPCPGCEELADPLVDPTSQGGVFRIGSFEEPSVDVILTMLDEANEDFAEEEEDAGLIEEDQDEDEEEEEVGECN
jgi:filamentous hemagglutinin family protein